MGKRFRNRVRGGGRDGMGKMFGKVFEKKKWGWNGIGSEMWMRRIFAGVFWEKKWDEKILDEENGIHNSFSSSIFSHVINQSLHPNPTESECDTNGAALIQTKEWAMAHNVA